MATRLYVGNLSFNTSDEDIRQAFSQCAEVSEVKLVLDRDTGRSRGFAFVEMVDEQGAQKAIEQLNGTSLDGRPLRVNEAEERKPRGGFGGGGGGGFVGGGSGGRSKGGRGGDRGGNRW